MNLQALAQILQAKGLGTVGQTIFLYHMPEIENAIVFRLPLQGVPIDHELPGRYRHTLQVVMRGPEQGALIEKAKQVVTALTLAETTVADMAITFIRPSALPITYPRSEQSHACETSINFDCCYVLG